jgi:predicted O-linked N-acetylglucosamine transferase (SPINDLY family)
MGVPVITFPGATFAGRHATSYLSNAGLTQFVAADWPGYIALAAQWANRPDELAALRGTLREQVRRSPLCDARRFADDLLAVLADAASAG